MTLGDEVRRLRKEAGFSQSQLAEVVLVTQGAITNIETGRNLNITVQTLYKLCDALNVNCDHFRPFLAEVSATEQPARPMGKRK